MRVIQTHVSLQFPHVLACFHFSAKEFEEILAGLQASEVTSKLSSRFGSCTRKYANQGVSDLFRCTQGACDVLRPAELLVDSLQVLHIRLAALGIRCGCDDLHVRLSEFVHLWYKRAFEKKYAVVLIIWK